MVSASLAPYCCGREIAALVHRGVENAHSTCRVGGWDSIRIDERLAGGGIRKVRHSVLPDALGECEGGVLLIGGPVSAARESRRLQVLAGGGGPLPLRAVRVQRGAVQHPIDRQVARRIRVRELADAVLTHALGELHRLLLSCGGRVAALAAA